MTLIAKRVYELSRITVPKGTVIIPAYDPETGKDGYILLMDIVVDPDGQYPTWEAGSYDTGDRVTWNFKLWESLVDSNETIPSEGANWTEVSSADTGSVVQATETVKGIVELATTTEAAAGLDTERAVTPAGLLAALGAAGTVFDTDVKYFEQFDWIGSVAGGSNNIAMGWAVLVSGTGAAWAFTQYGSDNTEHAIGAIEVQTGTTNAGMSVLSKGSANFSLGRGNTFKLRMRSALKNLSDGTERYTVYQGFGDSIGSVEHTNGAYFRYSDSVNGGRWQAVVRDGGVETSADTGVAADLLYSIFEIRVNSGATSVAFYINGVLVATLAANIPSGATDYLGLNFKILKSVGTTSRSFVMDWYDLLITRTVAR